jgi:aminoglycoside phosphotransferase (APT) family kinase protein
MVATVGSGSSMATHRHATSARSLGEIVLLDWEDVGLGDGIADIAWFLVSSVGPERWQEVLDAYPDTSGLGAVLPAAVV